MNDQATWFPRSTDDILPKKNFPLKSGYLWHQHWIWERIVGARWLWYITVLGNWWWQWSWWLGGSSFRRSSWKGRWRRPCQGSESEILKLGSNTDAALAFLPLDWSKMFSILLYWSWVVTMRQVAAMAAAPKVAAWSWTYLGGEHTGESRVDRGDLCLTWVKVKVFVLSFYLSERARQSPTKTSSVPPWHSPGHHDQL